MTNSSKNEHTKLERFLAFLPIGVSAISCIFIGIILWLPIMDKGFFSTKYWWGGFALFWFIYLIILNIFTDVKKLYRIGRLKYFFQMCFIFLMATIYSVFGFQSVWLISSLSMAETQNMSAQVLDANIKETSKSPNRKWVLQLSNGQTVRVTQPRSRSFAIGDTVSVSVRENQWGIWVEPDL